MHTTKQHRHVSARVTGDETNVLEFRKGTCKKQVRDSAGGLLWNLNEYGGDIGQQCSAAQCCRRVYEHDGLAPVEFLKDRLIIKMSQPLLVEIGRQSDAVRFEYAIGVLDFAQAGLGIWTLWQTDRSDLREFAPDRRHIHSLGGPCVCLPLRRRTKQLPRAIERRLLLLACPSLRAIVPESSSSKQD